MAEDFSSGLMPQQGIPHLRAVAVADYQKVAFFQKRNQLGATAFHISKLLGIRAFLPRAEQGVATEGNHYKFRHG